MTQTSPHKAARASYAVAAAVVCLLHLLAPAYAQQPDNSNARGGRTKRVTPLKTRDSQQGARVTITSDGALSDYSAYRSGDRFIVVIPQAEGGGGAAKGRGFEGAQVSRRGKDLVYTFKLEPGASARVNQRFNQLDVQFTASKSSAPAGGNATPAPTPAATPRATRTPPEIAGLPSPTPPARPTVDPRVVSEAGQQAATAQQPAPTPGGASSDFPLFNPTPEAAASPTAEPSIAPTVPAEQIAQAQPQQQAAPGGAVAQPSTNPATTATLGATLINNWPWIIAALLAVGVGLLFIGRRGARREQQEILPPAAMAVPALRETKAAPPAGPAATPAKITPTKITPTAEAATPVVAPVVTPAAKPAAKAAPVAEPRGKKKKKKGKAAASPQPADAKGAPPAEDTKTFDTEKTVERARPAAPAAVEAKADAARLDLAKADAANLVAPVAAVVAASDEPEAAAPAFDSERVGSEVKSLLAGTRYDEQVVGATDAGTRQLVAAELSAALTGRNAERQARARAAFQRHGYFDDATRDLQSAEAPGRRAAAAQVLALVADRAATPHLVAALEDPSADVRRASVEALAELRDPAAVGPLEALRWREQSRQVPRQLIMHAVELCSAPAAEEADETETTLVRDTTVEAATSAPAVAEETSPSASETVAPPHAEIAASLPTQDAATLDETTLEVATPELTKDEPESREIELKDDPESKEIELAAAPAATVADAAALEEARGASPAESLVESEAVETFVSEAATHEAEAAEVEAATAESVAAETSAGGEAVYTFDEDEAAAWADHRAAPALPQEEDLLAELDALEAAGAEARAKEQAEARQAYVAPEFALKDEGSAAEDWSEAGVTHVEPAEETTAAGPVALADEPAATADDSFSVAPAEPAVEAPAAFVGEVAEESSAAAEPAESVKSVELFDEATAAAQPAAESSAETSRAAGEETSFAIEPFRPEVASAEAPAAPSFAAHDADEVGLAPALEETPAPRGIAAHDEATVLDAPRHEKGLSASLEDAGGISIIPKAIQLRLESEDSYERAQSVLALARLNTDEAFTQICAAFDDRAEEVRDAAARALYEVSEDRAESFTRALREAPAERRRSIGAALASSGLADDAVSQLTGESRDRTYDAFSLLFLMAKAGESAPLIRAIESHPDNEVRLAVVKLLALSGQQEVLPAFRRLAVRGSLPTDVRAAVMEAIYQISSSGTAKTPAGTKP